MIALHKSVVFSSDNKFPSINHLKSVSLYVEICLRTIEKDEENFEERLMQNLMQRKQAAVVENILKM